MKSQPQIGAESMVDAMTILVAPQFSVMHASSSNAADMLEVESRTTLATRKNNVGVTLGRTVRHPPLVWEKVISDRSHLLLISTDPLECCGVA